jgi:hypothetical protein
MRSSRFTIDQVMMGIAVFASLLAVPRLAVSPDRIVMVCLVGLLTVLLLLNMLVEMVFGNPCRSCSRWTLRRLARYPRYYRCSACGGRCKRTRELPGELRHQPHPPTRRQQLDDAERKARNALNHLRDLRE